MAHSNLDFVVSCSTSEEDREEKMCGEVYKKMRISLKIQI